MWLQRRAFHFRYRIGFCPFFYIFPRFLITTSIPWHIIWWCVVPHHFLATRTIVAFRCTLSSHRGRRNQVLCTCLTCLGCLQDLVCVCHHVSPCVTMCHHVSLDLQAIQSARPFGAFLAKPPPLSCIWAIWGQLGSCRIIPCHPSQDRLKI